MTQQTVDQVPSQTALFTALRRALAYKLYHNDKFGPDHLAEVFLPGFYRFFLKFSKVRQNTAKKLSVRMPGMQEYVMARTAYFDELFVQALKESIPQIVLLGAGYDSRAYRFAQLNRGTRIFELDAQPTQERKRQCLKDAKISIPQEVQLVPVDFLRQALGDALAGAGYKPQEKTLFLWEGVSYYLDQPAVESTLGFVSQAHPQSVIAFDYALTLTEENMARYYGVMQFDQAMQVHHANESFLFTLPEGQVKAFLAQNQLRLLDCLGDEAIERGYLTDEQGVLIGKMTGFFCFVRAAPAEG